MARRARPRPRYRRTSKPKVGPHPFFPDETIPADWKGRLVCQSCRAVGAPGDPRHPESMPPPPAQPVQKIREQAALDAAILGETGDDDAVED